MCVSSNNLYFLTVYLFYNRCPELLSTAVIYTVEKVREIVFFYKKSMIILLRLIDYYYIIFLFVSVLIIMWWRCYAAVSFSCVSKKKKNDVFISLFFILPSIVVQLWCSIVLLLPSISSSFYIMFFSGLRCWRSCFWYRFDVNYGSHLFITT